MNLKIKLDEGAICPTRAHEHDAGLDLYSREPYIIPSLGSGVFNTGVHVEIPAGYVGYIKSKSGLMVKDNLTADGTIDAGYTGSIIVKLFNHGPGPVHIYEGQKIAQLVVQPIITPEVEIVDELGQTERGDNGFGSTGL